MVGAKWGGVEIAFQERQEVSFLLRAQSPARLAFPSLLPPLPGAGAAPPPVQPRPRQLWQGEGGKPGLECCSRLLRLFVPAATQEGGVSSYLSSPHQPSSLTPWVLPEPGPSREQQGPAG